MKCSLLPPLQKIFVNREYILRAIQYREKILLFYTPIKYCIYQFRKTYWSWNNEPIEIKSSAMECTNRQQLRTAKSFAENFYNNISLICYYFSLQSRGKCHVQEQHGLCCLDKSRCSSGPCGVDMSRTSTGLVV